MTETLLLKPPLHPDAAASQTEPAHPRDQVYDDEIKNFSARTLKDLEDKNLTAEQFFSKLRKGEDEEADRLKKMLTDNPNLSENQKKEIKAFVQSNDFDHEIDRIRAAHEANPNDPKATAEYEKMQKDLAEYRQLMYAAPELKDNQHLQAAAKLDAQLNDPALTDEQKKEIRHNRAVEFRGFMLDQAQDPHNDEKFIAFNERNKEDIIVQKSGMYDMAEALKEKRHELGLDTAQDQNHEIGTQAVTPSGPPKTGAVTAGDKEHQKTAETEVGHTVDTGEGHIKTQQFQQQHLPDNHVPPAPTQGTNAPSVKSLTR